MPGHRREGMGVSETTRIGTVFAGYRVESLLGRGGMSVVYLAEHVRLGRKVALKVLASPLTHDESYRERFVRESQRAADLDHPNVIPIYDAGEIEGGDTDGLLYIAMRYVDGSDLRTLVRRDGQLSVGRTIFMLEQVAAALDAAHDRDLIHRDVKPSNILVAEPSEHVYLTDFGVAKQTTAPDLTRTGVFVGTVDYAAPEQIEGLTLDRRTDIYALGCVLYECLAGRPPFDREAEVAVMHAHLATPPPKLTDVRPDLPKDLDRVIARAMAKSRDDRFDSASEMLNAAHASVLRRWAPATAPVEERHAHPVAPPQPEEPVASVAAAMPAAPDAVAEPSHTVTEQPASAAAPVAAEPVPAPAATGSSAAAPPAPPVRGAPRRSGLARDGAPRRGGGRRGSRCRVSPGATTTRRRRRRRRQRRCRRPRRSKRSSRGNCGRTAWSRVSRRQAPCRRRPAHSRATSRCRTHPITGTSRSTPPDRRLQPPTRPRARRQG